MIEIKNKKDCCGCSACANVCPKQCITMQEDNEGFLYPLVDKNICVNCGLCEKVCPITNPIEERVFEQKAALFQNSNAKILRESTSGGFFSAIAQWALDRNGVVFGAALDDNLEVAHRYIENAADLRFFRNSKYTQSRIGNCFRDARSFLKDGRLVVFSGTPCQLEGLHRFLGRDYENLVKVDVVCHACPSPKVYRKYIEWLENRFSQKTTLVKFREKAHGYKYSAMQLLSDKGPFYTEGIDTDPFLRLFFNNVTDRPSCYSCHAKKRYRVTDFTMWDCFDVGKFSKKLDNDLGVTRILLHTPKAVQIWNEIKKNGAHLEISADDAVEGVKELVKSVPENAVRSLFFEDLDKMSMDNLIKKYAPTTIRNRLEKQARLWSDRFGLYKIAKKIFKLLHGNRDVKR